MMPPAVSVADGPDARPRSKTIQLPTPDHLVPLLRRLLEGRFAGELVIRGGGDGRVCLYDGAIAWVGLEGHPEHLGDVCRRELGIDEHTLSEVIAHCKATGRRLIEGIRDRGLMRQDELRDCLLRHIRAQLLGLLSRSGPMCVELRPRSHRYDDALTYRLEQLLCDPIAVDEHELEHLVSRLERYCEQIPDIQAACVVQTQTGETLASLTDDGDDSQLVLGLCCAEMRRLIDNRVTGRHHDAPDGLLLIGKSASIVVHGIAWRPGLSLVLGGMGSIGRLLSVAQALAVSSPPTRSCPPGLDE